jgi:hypothetical protein
LIVCWRNGSKPIKKPASRQMRQPRSAELNTERPRYSTVNITMQTLRPLETGAAFYYPGHGSGGSRRTSSGRKFSSASWFGIRRRLISLTLQAGPTTSWTAAVASLGLVAATQYSVSPPLEAATTYTAPLYSLPTTVHFIRRTPTRRHAAPRRPGRSRNWTLALSCAITASIKGTAVLQAYFP